MHSLPLERKMTPLLYHSAPFPVSQSILHRHYLGTSHLNSVKPAIYHLIVIAEKISFQEFKQRNIPEMAKFIGKVKEQQPHTKSRHSRQAWIESVSGRSDRVIASIEER